MPSMDWEERAACRDFVEVFDATFDSSSRTSARHHGLAAEVCDACPVQRACLQEALAVETAATRFGMRAGLMPAQRSHLARRSA